MWRTWSRRPPTSPTCATARRLRRPTSGLSHCHIMALSIHCHISGCLTTWERGRTEWYLETLRASSSGTESKLISKKIIKYVSCQRILKGFHVNRKRVIFMKVCHNFKRGWILHFLISFLYSWLGTYYNSARDESLLLLTFRHGNARNASQFITLYLFNFIAIISNSYL